MRLTHEWSRRAAERSGARLIRYVRPIQQVSWGATIGRPAFVTSTVADLVGSPARTFRQWVVDHADAFRRRPAEYGV